ncbi:MAG: L-glutamate gamma-semialdehyde dehydrogenase [Planctomycetota bacterium]
MSTDFKNEPLTDFSVDENRRAMAQAVASVADQLGQSHPSVIGSERITLDDTLSSVNPSKPSEVIGVFPQCGRDHAARAIETAAEAFESWKHVPATERAEVLFKTAATIRHRKFEYAAWMCFEAGKNWAEADGDVAEAIDFLEFYGREAIRYDTAGKVTPTPGEDNGLEYIPLGVGAIIPPWNFPLAIAVGMSSAAIAAGNTVVLKPASTTPTIAWKYVEAFLDAGLPAGVLNFVTGPGSKVGNTMVEHHKTRFISFTGSMEVGLQINELAAKKQPGQLWIKRVVAEMGGKDAMVIDKDTDLDDVAQGIVAAAFGYSGQKCSACSRAIIHQDVYDAVVEKVVERTNALKVGAAIDADTNVGPVIDESAMRKIGEYIEIGKGEGRLLAGGEAADPSEGYFIQPTVFADIKNDARLSKEEIFGPVLVLTKAKDFDEAIAFANDTEFGLTGAAFSNDEENLKKAARDFHVGNLYLNRKCTGALVGAHPFGGFNMSGTDSKAGGFDYLQLFLQGKLVSRKV